MQGAEFMEVLERMIPEGSFTALCEQHAPSARGGRKLSPASLVQSLLFHQLQGSGTLAEHGQQLHGIGMSDSAYAQRRGRLPVELFEALMEAALAPLAEPAGQPESFFEGYRLLGIDGTQWSVGNTPAIVRALPKAASRRFKAAFAKLRLVTLIELGTHAPLAARAAPAGQSEQALAQAIWGKVPEHSLLIADRLFGTPKTLAEALHAWAGRDIQCLVRVRKNLKPKRLERLSDGSALIEVAVRAESGGLERITLREIRARGLGIHGKRFTLRLWTTLLDESRFPALDLARRYASRWECELYYRELKLDVRHNPLLAGHTVESALQELAALVLASALIARLRVEAAERSQLPPSRVSFYKLMHLTEALWLGEAIYGEIATRADRAQVLARFFAQVRATALLPERRARSCPRAVRQPVTGWPRKTTQRSHTGEITLELRRV